MFFCVFIGHQSLHNSFAQLAYPKTKGNAPLGICVCVCARVNRHCVNGSLLSFYVYECAGPLHHCVHNGKHVHKCPEHTPNNVEEGEPALRRHIRACCRPPTRQSNAATQSHRVQLMIFIFAMILHAAHPLRLDERPNRPLLPIYRAAHMKQSMIFPEVGDHMCNGARVRHGTSRIYRATFSQTPH